ncbi:hypothetical protein VB715_20940 [Crocosphaera sp. UHCC 0190]|uniref:hypothetical protein n=1 Tax=Crocosphaera sp. UHCC 0190 TaxID=3110246 RepID=UPI002B2214DF|nr:hypothetical protein [Crocosphaera sp. UHCC 0190]MEA5512242.1 hypothetical protein [Crocosphaera sp. UHCC 0190]
MVELVTHELDIDPEEGFIFPKDSQIIEINVIELSRLAVEAVIASHDEFKGYYIAGFWKPQEAEF